jgi:pilus assembly protein CpaE
MIMNDLSRRPDPENAVAPLKVLLAGASDEPLERMAGALRSRAPHDDIVVGDGDHAGLPMLVARHDPDVLILVEPRAGPGALALVERLTHLYPGMSPIVLCDDQSAEFLMQAMRAGVREILPTASGGAALVDAVGRIGEKHRARPEQHGQVLAFLSCKGGGGGATFLASNVAYALAAEEGKRVVLIDLNLQWGDAVFFVTDKKPTITLADLAMQMHRVDPAFLASSLVHVHANMGVLAAPEDPVHALDVKPEHIDVLVRIARSQYDFVILDMGRALDAVTVRALDYADAIFPVMQLSLPFIRDGRRLLAAFRSLDYPDAKIRVVVNRYEKGGDITLEDLESTLGRKAFRTVPNDYDRVAKSINQGVPIVQLAHGSAVAKSLREFAHELATVQTKPASGWLDRMLHRT